MKHNKVIAKSSIRRKLWDSLNLTQHDGNHYRESGTHGDTIVLSLLPSKQKNAEHIKEFEGLKVRIEEQNPVQAFQYT